MVSRTYVDGCDNCGSQRWQPMRHADGAPYLECAECGRRTKPAQRDHTAQTEDEVNARQWEGWERELSALHAALVKEVGALDLDIKQAETRGLRLLRIELGSIRARLVRLAESTDRLLGRRRAA
jgi:hypothetical protein